MLEASIPHYLVPQWDPFALHPKLGSFPLTVTVTTMGYRSYRNPLSKKAPLKTVTGRGNDLSPKPTMAQF